MKVVIIGGGNGSAIAINAIKPFCDEVDLSAVISMSDSGGSSGKLRDEFDTLPPGDILRAILAMSKSCEYSILRKIFNKIRFQNAGNMSGHNLGNLFLILSEKYAGDFITPIRTLEQSVDAFGTVFPVTLDKTDLIARLTNGDIINTEAKIDRPNYDRKLKIESVWLEPEGNVYDEAKDAIKKADYIILAPGSLYCSVIAPLLVGGVKQAIESSMAEIIFTAGNAYELDGETGPEKLSQFVFQLQKYLPRKIDKVIFNSTPLSQKKKKMYEERKWALFEPDIQLLRDYEVVEEDYSKNDPDSIGLCSDKLGRILKERVFE